MKKFMVIAILFASIVSLASAQEEPIPPKRSKAAMVGGFGGFTPGLLFVDVKPINDELARSGGAAMKDGGVWMLGGGGAAYIMLVPNLRVGGVGMSGGIRSTAVDGLGVRRDAELHVGFGGVTIEYVVPVTERMNIAVGGMLGTGGMDITMRKDVAGQSLWSQQWGYLQSGTPFGGPISNSTRKLSGSFFVWVPTLNVEYAILGWVGLRLGASYVGMSGGSWKVDDNYELLGVPSSISGKGFMVHTGLFLGTY